MSKTYDFIIAGAGIVGVTLAREIKRRWPECTVLILEKEPEPGRHSSGRNSGVLHSGIYYTEGTLKARLCASGARRLAGYCDEHKLPIDRSGKVILPGSPEEDGQLDVLAQRAKTNGARVELIDNQRLAELEPAARSVTNRALYAPETSVIDSGRVLSHLIDRLRADGVEFRLNSALGPEMVSEQSLKLDNDRIAYGMLINAAGLHADRVAHIFGAGRDYVMMPFKGIYRRLKSESGIDINGLIYPVPDLRVPFLGVHFTRTIDGAVYVGPTAMPAFGRENYRGFRGVELMEGSRILWRLARLYRANQQGFRRLVYQEGERMLRGRFAAAAHTMVPALRPEHLGPISKVGIRAQLMNLATGLLEMDFVVERKGNTVHVLNAVSPAYTSSMAFAEYVVDEYIEAPAVA